MSNEKELLAKAESGDDEAMFDVAQSYFQQGDINEALIWWEKSANAGNKNATVNLVILYVQNPSTADKDKFLKWLRKLAYDFNDGWALIVLGSIYCGVRHRIIDTFESDAFVALKNPDEGYQAH